MIALGDQGVAQVRADKTGATGDENAHSGKSIGAHIFDHATCTIVIGAKSATALGPDGGLADVLAIGMMVAGEDDAKWFAQPELAEYSAWVIDRHSGGAWGVGPAIL